MHKTQMNEAGYVTFHGMDEAYPAAKIIYVEVRNIYGEDRIYPICSKGRLFARLAKTKTLTPEVIDTLKELGYTFIQEEKTL